MKPRVLVAAGNMDRFVAPWGAVAMEEGDFVSIESNAAVLMDTATEDATFAGYLINRKPLTGYSEPDNAVVGIRGVLETDCASAGGDTYTFMKALIYSAKNKVQVSAGVNEIAWVGKKPAATVTRLTILIDAPALGKFFTAAA